MAPRKNKGKKRYYKKKTTLTKKVNKLARTLAPERKYVDYSIDNNSVDVNGDIYPLNRMAQGITNITRIGNVVKNIYLSAGVTMLPYPGTYATNSTFMQVRLIMFWDKRQLVDSNPTVGDLLDSSATYNVNSNYNITKIGRWGVIHDQVYALDASRSTHIKIKKNLKGQISKFNGANSSDIEYKGLYICILSNMAATYFPTVYYNQRLSFTDA